MKKILFSFLLLASFFAGAQTNTFNYIKQTTYTATGTDTYAVSIPGIASNVPGLELKVVFTNANTGTASLNVNTIGPVTLKKSGSTNLTAGDIPAGATFRLTYDGTYFQVLGIGGGGGGVTDHGALTGLGDDDHTQYHNDARGDARYPLLSGGYVNPSFITSLPWSKITSTPTTIAGYGITDFNSLGDARWWALGGNSTLTGAVTINGSSSNHDITIGDTNEIGIFRVQSIGAIYLSNAVSTYSGAFRLGGNGNVGLDHSYFKIPSSGYGVELGNTPIGGGVKLSSGSNAGQLEIGKYTGTNGDNPYVKFDLTVGSDATGDTYYRNSSGYFTRLPAGTNGHVLTLSGGIPSWASPSTLSDGDKGDITVNGGGTNWTIDNSTVTLAKMANMATSSLIYRKTAGTGAPEVNTLATLKTDLGLTGTNSGDQTSIVGITGTTSQFNTALSDNDFATLLGSETLSNKTLGGGTWWSSAPTITDGLTITFNPNGTQAGFNFGSHASNPSVGNPGDGYYNSTDNDVMLNDGNWRPAVLTDKVQTLTNKTISPTANTIRYPTRTQSGTSYTIQASDENYIIQFTSASAIAVTLPDGLSTNFNCTLMNYGGGVITVTAATTLNTAGSANTIETQYTGASFQHVGSNVWDGVGALGSAGGGSGDVVGPASSTNNNVVFFDGTTGKLIKDSGLTLSGTNTGDQTTITGNAGSATQLQTSRTIWGQSFNGTANVTGSLTLGNNSLLDGSGNEVITLSGVGSAINEITIQNAGASGYPAIFPSGGDTDIGLAIYGKGAGEVYLPGAVVVGNGNYSTGTAPSVTIRGNNISSTATSTGGVTINGGQSNTTSASTSGSVGISAGAAIGTNTSSGSVTIATQAPTGSGTEGSVEVQTRSAGKLGFFAATPVVKQSAASNTQGIADALTAYGLLPSSTILDNTTRKSALTIEADFYTDTSPYSPSFVGTAISGGTDNVIAGEANHPGIIDLRDGTTANGGWNVSTAANAFLLAGGEKAVITFQIRNARATANGWMGFKDNSTNAQPTDGAYVYFVGNGTTVTMDARTRSNSTETINGTTWVPTLNTWYTLVITVNSAGTQVDYEVFNDAGTSQWAVNNTANIPTGAGRQTGFGIQVNESTTDAAAAIMYLDYARMEINRILVR